MLKRFFAPLLSLWLALAPAVALAWPVHGAAGGGGGGGGVAFAGYGITYAGGGNLTTATFPMAAASGQLAIYQSFSGGGTPCVPSSAGGSWNVLLANQPFDGSGSFSDTSIYYKQLNATDLTGSITVTGGCNFGSAAVYLYTGATLAVYAGTPTAGSDPVYANNPPGNTLGPVVGFTPSGATKAAVILYISVGTVFGETLTGWTSDVFDDSTRPSSVHSIWRLNSYAGTTPTFGGNASTGGPAIAQMLELQ